MSLGKSNGTRKGMDPRLAAAIFMALGLFCLISGIIGLTYKTEPLDSFWEGGERSGVKYEYTAHYGTPAFAQVEHTINYIIPAGTEYYCLVFDDELENAAAVRVSKSWYDKNFNSSGESSGGVKIKGRVRRMDSDVQSRLRSSMDGLTEAGISCDTMYYIDDIGQTLLVLRVLEGAYIIGFCIFLFVLIKRNAPLGAPSAVGGKAGAVLLVTTIIASILGLYLIIIG